VSEGLNKDDMLAALRAGRAGGTWSGTAGITSSVAAASGGSRTVGWLENGDGSVTVACAAMGDTNLDWTIDVVDVANILAGGKFNTGLPASWNDGDFNYDGVVDTLDVAKVLTSELYGTGSYAGAREGGNAVAVPEPSTARALSLAVGVAAVMRMIHPWKPPPAEDSCRNHAMRNP
jgi:hypothetical protein